MDALDGLARQHFHSQSPIPQDIPGAMGEGVPPPQPANAHPNKFADDPNSTYNLDKHVYLMTHPDADPAAFDAYWNKRHEVHQAIQAQQAAPRPAAAPQAAKAPKNQARRDMLAATPPVSPVRPQPSTRRDMNDIPQPHGDHTNVAKPARHQTPTQFQGPMPAQAGMTPPQASAPRPTARPPVHRQPPAPATMSQRAGASVQGGLEGVGQGVGDVVMAPVNAVRQVNKDANAYMQAGAPAPLAYGGAGIGAVGDFVKGAVDMAGAPARYVGHLAAMRDDAGNAATRPAASQMELDREQSRQTAREIPGTVIAAAPGVRKAGRIAGQLELPQAPENAPGAIRNVQPAMERAGFRPSKEPMPGHAMPKPAGNGKVTVNAPPTPDLKKDSPKVKGPGPNPDQQARRMDAKVKPKAKPNGVGAYTDSQKSVAPKKPYSPPNPHAEAPVTPSPEAVNRRAPNVQKAQDEAGIQFQKDKRAQGLQQMKAVDSQIRSSNKGPKATGGPVGDSMAARVKGRDTPLPTARDSFATRRSNAQNQVMEGVRNYNQTTDIFSKNPDAETLKAGPRPSGGSSSTSTPKPLTEGSDLKQRQAREDQANLDFARKNNLNKTSRATPSVGVKNKTVGGNANIGGTSAEKLTTKKKSKILKTTRSNAKENAGMTAAEKVAQQDNQFSANYRKITGTPGVSMRAGSKFEVRQRPPSPVQENPNPRKNANRDITGPAKGNEGANRYQSEKNPAVQTPRIKTPRIKLPQAPTQLQKSKTRPPEGTFKKRGKTK